VQVRPRQRQTTADVAGRPQAGSIPAPGTSDCRLAPPTAQPACFCTATDLTSARTQAGHGAGWREPVSETCWRASRRTRAAVSVTVGYSGTTLVLVKEQRSWRAVEMLGVWVT
jgi:hypothetical protein